MIFLYELFIRTYFLLIRLYANFNRKARRFVEGRKDWQKQTEKIAASGKKKIWLHCASLGEFEQGRPVIEKLRELLPDHEIILTFFSPSGYEIRQNYEGAEHVIYLPMDTRHNAKKFIRRIRPSLVVFVKYEFWFNYINELYKSGIPLYMISVNFRPGQHYFKWYGKWFAQQLRKVNWFFVQNERSRDLLHSIDIRNVKISGDTRFDRVHKIARQAEPIPEIESFMGGDKVFLAGSSWPPGERMIRELYDKKMDGIKFIIAPHDVGKSHIDELQHKLFPGALLFSEIDKHPGTDSKVLIIDSIGQLSRLYQYAHISYIGGGFGVGIHNILEAATFGSPVLFGPNYGKFQEAVDLVQLGGAFVIKNANALIRKTDELFHDQEFHEETADICRNYVEHHRGATEMITAQLRKDLDPGN